jgi:hypothetical protein
MTQPLKGVICEVEVKPGQKLTLPEEVVNRLAPGKYSIAIIPTEELSERPIRDHSALLNGYSPEDEGLYDDLVSRRLAAVAKGNRPTGYEGFLSSYGLEDEGLYDDCVAR